MESRKSKLLYTDQEKFFNWIQETFIMGIFFTIGDRSFTMSTGRLIPLIDNNKMTIWDRESSMIFKVIPTSGEIARIDALIRTNDAEFTAIFEDVWNKILYQYKQHIPGEKQKQKRGPHPETEDKLKRLREIRLDAIKDNGRIPTKSVAIDEAGISAKTCKKHDPELWARWNDKNYK